MSMIAATQIDDRRAASRHPVDWPSAVRVNGQFVPCRLIELSRLGARVRVSKRPPVGAHVTLELPEREYVIAKVVRATDDYIALAFPGLVMISSLVEDEGEPSDDQAV